MLEEENDVPNEPNGLESSGSLLSFPLNVSVEM